MTQTEASPSAMDELFDKETTKILNDAIKSVPQEVWNSIATTSQQVIPVSMPEVYVYASSTGTGNAII